MPFRITGFLSQLLNIPEGTDLVTREELDRGENAALDAANIAEAAESLGVTLDPREAVITFHPHGWNPEK